MISRLEVKGFKSLSDVSIDLGSVNVFVGANGSGKSNILEAVGVLSAIVSGGPEAESFRYRGVRLGSPASYLSSFEKQSHQLLSITACSSRTCYKVDMAPKEHFSTNWLISREEIDFDGHRVFYRTDEGPVFEISGEEHWAVKPYNYESRSIAPYASFIYDIKRTTGDTKRFDADGTTPPKPSEDAIVKITSNQVIYFLEQLAQFAIYSPSTPQLRGFLDDIHREPLGLGGSGLGRAIDAMTRDSPESLGPFDLSDIYDLIDWADGIDTNATTSSSSESSYADSPVRLRIRDRYMGTAHKSVSTLEASEGALYVLFLLALVGHKQSPKIFSVDNFDQALHPRLACALTRLVSDQIVEDGSRQMLATTHNPLVLDGLNLLDDRIRLFAVDRDSQGATQVKRVLLSEELMSQAENGLSLSRLWVMGRLGGVPKSL